MAWVMLVVGGSLVLAAVGYVLTFIWRVVKGERAEPVKQKHERLLIVVGWAFLVVGAVYLGAHLIDTGPAYRLSADELYREFSENELAAFAKYHGELVEITGRVAQGGVTFGQPYVLLNVSSFFEAVQCDLASEQIVAASRLSVGDEVRLLGEVYGERVNLLLTGCYIVE